MATPAQLALLTSKAQQIEPSARGKDQITWEDMAGAKARMPKHVSMYASAKYQGDLSAVSGVYAQLLYQVLFRIAVPQDWHAGLADKLCRIAIAEELPRDINELVPNVCRVCNGIGSKEVDKKVEVCGKCGGNGFLQFTNEVIMDFLGIKKTQYYKVYKRRLDMVRSIIWAWDGRVWEACRQVQ